MTLSRRGPLYADGGCLFVLAGAAPNAAVAWSLTGGGALTPTATHTDANGTASAVYLATAGTPADAGSTVTVGASVHA